MSEDEGFMTTRWSVVGGAAGSEREALEALCRAYWRPLYGWARRSGLAKEDAEDATQAFFADLLDKGWLGRADKEKGRFRTFLLQLFKRYLVDDWRRRQARKRGGGHQRVGFDTALAEEELPAGDGLAPDDAYDRQWALTVLARATSRLREEHERSGRAAAFEVLKRSLAPGAEGPDYGSASRELGITTGAARVAAHRMRARFRTLLREEVGGTVRDEADIDEEMRCLLDALTK